METSRLLSCSCRRTVGHFLSHTLRRQLACIDVAALCLVSSRNNSNCCRAPSLKHEQLNVHLLTNRLSLIFSRIHIAHVSSLKVTESVGQQDCIFPRMMGLT